MTASDQPRPPDEGTMRPGPPELVRVGRRNGFRPAIAVVAVVAVLLAVAVWKPWEPGGSAAATRSTISPGAAGALLPAITGRPDGSVAPARAPSPSALTFAGLDLSVMGSRDPHDAWGVAVGYVSQIQFDSAVGGHKPTVTPVVSWELIEPGHAGPGPVLDHPGVTSVAIAATWPSLSSATQPVTVRLFRFWHTDPGPLSGPSSNPVAGVEVPLGATLDDLVGTAASANPSRGLRSGAFFMPSVTPNSVSTWPGAGWPAGMYTVELDLVDGDHVSLPFVIGSAAAP
jgi:hypothetical protein